MQSPEQVPDLDGAERLVGEWTTEATHRLLPGDHITGRSTIEWLDGRRFLIQRSHYDHPRIPDAITITGVTDGRLSTHYFDSRGVHRVYAASIDAGRWRFWADLPEFSQRVTNTPSDDGTTITGLAELADDRVTWQDDLTIMYRRS